MPRFVLINIVLKPDSKHNLRFLPIWCAVALGAAALTMAPSRPLAAVMAAGESPALHRLLERLQRHYQETESFTAKFDETITRPGAPPLKRNGALSWLRPGRIRFDYAAPQPETIVSDGHTLYDYDPGLNQVIETPLKNAIKAQAAAALLLGAGNLERDFAASSPSTPSRDGLEYAILTPRVGGPRVEIGADAATSNIVSLTITDALGNRTGFHFFAIRLNVAIAASVFSFKTPDGADVVTSGAGL